MENKNKREIITEVQTKYIQYLSAIDKIGVGVMYQKDVVALINEKSLPQTYKILQKLEKYEVLDSYMFDGKKVVYLTRLAYTILGKKDGRKLSVKSHKLIKSSMRATLYNQEKDFFLYHQKRVSRLYQAIQDFYGDKQIQYWKRQEEIFAFQKEILFQKKEKQEKEFRCSTFQQLEKKGIYLSDFDLESNTIDFSIIYYDRAGQERMLHHIEEIMYLFEELGEHVRLNITVYTPYDTGELINGRMKAIRKYRRQKKWQKQGNHKFNPFDKYINRIDVKKLDIVHRI